MTLRNYYKKIIRGAMYGYMSTDGKDFIMCLNGSDQIRLPHMLLRDYKHLPEDAPGFIRFGVETYCEGIECGKFDRFTRDKLKDQFDLSYEEIESCEPKLIGLFRCIPVLPDAAKYDEELREEYLEESLMDIDIFNYYIEKDGTFNDSVGYCEKLYFQKEAKKWLDKLNAIIETDTTDYDFGRNVILFDGYDVKIVDMDKSPYLR